MVIFWPVEKYGELGLVRAHNSYVPGVVAASLMDRVVLVDETELEDTLLTTDTGALALQFEDTMYA